MSTNSSNLITEGDLLQILPDKREPWLLWMQGLVVVVVVGVEGRSAFHVFFFPLCRLSGESFLCTKPSPC